MPDSPDGYDGLVVLGGPQHAGDDAGYPAFPPMLALIRRFHDQAKPVLGVCLGAQLIARAFGGARLALRRARDRLSAGAPDARRPARSAAEGRADRKPGSCSSTRTASICPRARSG